MSDKARQDVSREIKRRTRELYKRSLYCVIPLAVTTLGAWAHAPTPLVIAAFWLIWVGIVICMVSLYRLSRCPACNARLAFLLALPPGYRRCPHCHASFQGNDTKTT